MNIEDQIQSLADLAAPLRELDDDDPAKAPLAGIVDEINRLRAVQARNALEINAKLIPHDAGQHGRQLAFARHEREQERQGREEPVLRPEVAAVLGGTPREAQDLAAKHAQALQEARAAATDDEARAKTGPGHDEPAKPRRKPGPKPKGVAK